MPNNWGKRPDGTNKGNGWLGTIKNAKGEPMTELSVGVHFDGKERLIPSLVPGISSQDMDTIKAGGRIPNRVIDNAVRHARKQLSKGRSPFYEGETGPASGLSPRPPITTRDILDAKARMSRPERM